MPHNAQPLRHVNLSDKYNLSINTVYLTGTQALVRLCLLQAERDRAAGLHTAGYVTGYRGSPLGGLDQQFHSAQQALDSADIVFQPGLNEDLAATAVWGTQQVALRGEGKKDGVFALWYGKGPGVDRSGDAFRHGNLAGSAQLGGVLALLGDDHTCESSTTCHQSEYALVDAMMPVLNPANITELVALGLHGWALSRFSGLWVGLKCVKDNVESSGSVCFPTNTASPQQPDIDLPPGGLNIRPRDDRHEQERRLHRWKLNAARAYARANKLDQVHWTGGAQARIGLISTGKSWMDTATALEDLGLDESTAARMHLSTYKVAMVWPLEPEGLRAFAAGLELLIVIEEKRGLIESQAREILYATPQAPTIVGKHDEHGALLFPSDGALNPVMIAQALAARLPQPLRPLPPHKSPAHALPIARTPYFCAGCPHNSSTILPEGARGYAGIGCHWMSQMMDRATEGYTHMGAEGANWIGEAPFCLRAHIFQNLGDGTYNHSGLMAIRAAIAAGVNITYKILYNDAVAMTGGQAHEGGLPLAQIAAEVIGAGAAKLEIVSDQPEALNPRDFPATTKIHHRDQLQAVQSALAQVKGVSILLYQQTCATEKRRRRKRGLIPDLPRRVMINPEVCEGCGDCGLQSNCVAIQPLKTALGDKRMIDQSGCNKDFSCLKGFCPSFVSIEGGQLRKPDAHITATDNLPTPAAVLTLDQPRSILVTGVGGTGVVTVGALLGMAAHLEGKGAGLIDMAGLAQKGGAVTTHIRLAKTPEQIKAIRIAAGHADLMLGADALTSAADALLALMKPEGYIVANTHELMPGAFVRDRTVQLPQKTLQTRLLEAVPAGHTHLTDATALAIALVGDSLAANVFLLGAAWQKGLIPLGKAAIEQAITLNGVAPEANLRAFSWGRAWAVDPASVSAHQQRSLPAPDSLAALIADRTERLTAYQNARYAARYRAFVHQVFEQDPDPEKPLTQAVAQNLYRLMAYKDEYEVARLLSDVQFERQIRAQFQGQIRITHHLAPPLFSRTDPATGRPKKRPFGPWIRPFLRGLRHLKRLRGTWADPFGYSAERKMERQLIDEYRQLINGALKQLDTHHYAQLVTLAQSPDQIRGFGPVKWAAIEKVRAWQTAYSVEQTRPAPTTQ